MRNILYICDPKDIHDQKWFTYFSDYTTEFKVYLIFENSISVNEHTIEILKSKNIDVIGSLSSFSISSPYKTLKSVRILRKLIADYKIDFVHVLFATPYSIWTNYISVPHCITTRGSDVLIVLPGLLQNTGIKRVYFRWLYSQFKKAFEHAEFITCTSSAQIRKVQENFKVNQIELIRTGVDYNGINNCTQIEFLPQELKNINFIFSPRFFSPIYNIKFQLESILLLPSDIIKEFTFVFIKGKNHDVTYSNEVFDKLKVLSDTIGLKYLVFDYLDQKTLWTLYNFASLTIMTPLSDGTPNSGLEAMAAKCPLIIPSLDYDKDIFNEKTCFIYRQQDVEHLTKCIIDVINSDNSSMLSNAKDAVNKNGNRSNEMNKLMNLYQKTF